MNLSCKSVVCCLAAACFHIRTHTHTHGHEDEGHRHVTHTHTHTVVIRPYLGEGNSCVPPKFSSLSASLGDIQDFSHTHTHTRMLGRSSLAPSDVKRFPVTGAAAPGAARWSYLPCYNSHTQSHICTHTLGQAANTHINHSSLSHTHTL